MSEKDEARVERGPSMQRPEALGMAMLLERGGQTGAAAIMREQHAEIERLRADAERYRWLRARDHWPACFDLVQGPELDAAIDAAREPK